MEQGDGCGFLAGILNCCAERVGDLAEAFRYSRLRRSCHQGSLPVGCLACKRQAASTARALASVR
jgi:hypothetical protein